MLVRGGVLVLPPSWWIAAPGAVDSRGAVRGGIPGNPPQLVNARTLLPLAPAVADSRGAGRGGFPWPPGVAESRGAGRGGVPWCRARLSTKTPPRTNIITL